MTGDPAGPRTVRSPVPVVAAVIRREGAVLLGLRPEGKRHASMWEFPGGKVLDGESFADALGRELREELRVSLMRAGEPMFATRDPGSRFEIHFVPAEIEGQPRALEHRELRWVAVSELPALPLAPADARFAGEGLGG
ncbi:MAG TPA: NUDIX domain-containing protein [Gemmatimonadota bacterium]|nr:NUDIX domain-containing protein [Gemmatimonadota bacterium]